MSHLPSRPKCQRPELRGTRAPSRGDGLSPTSWLPPSPGASSAAAGRASSPHSKPCCRGSPWAPLLRLLCGQTFQPRGWRWPGGGIHSHGSHACTRHPGTGLGGMGLSFKEAVGQALWQCLAPWQPSPFFWDGSRLGHQISSAETNKG